ncbi:MAG: substrate-binding domain-containing protein [Tessaracoccus sp.]
MSENAKYYVKTVLLGYLAIPPLVGILAFVALIALSETDPTPASWVARSIVGLTLAALLVTVPLSFAWGRKKKRPDDWARALLPVAAVPALLLLVWTAAFLVTGHSWHSADEVLLGAGFTWLIGAGVGILFNSSFGVPLLLITTLLGSVGGFVWGAHARPPSGRRALAAILAGSVGLSVAAAGIAGYRMWQQWQWDALERVSAEVDLWLYHPWDADSVVVDVPMPSSLTISEQFPLLDGATALYPVYSAAARAVYDPPMAADSDEIYGFADTYVACTRTSEAYDRLISGDADAIFVLQPSQGHLDKAAQRGVELDLTPIGHDAFVFFVNAENPVEGLTLDQVRAIYTREITNWAQVGGPDEEIVGYQRPEDSGSQTAMLAEVMGEVPMAEPLTEELSPGMGMVIEQVAEYRNQTAAIGYSFRWYATEMNASPNITLLEIDGVAPTAENIADGSYPLTVDLYAATAGSTNPHVPELIDWMVSEEGQALVDAVGYVPLSS